MTIQFGDDIRAAVSMVYRGVDIFQNILHYEAGVGVSDSEANVIAAIAAHLLTSYNNMNTVTCDQLAGQQIDFWKRNTGTGLWDAIGTADFTGWVPTDVSDETPSGVAAVVRFFTQGIGRQGRLFFPCLGEDQVTNGIWLAGALAALGNLAAALVSNVAVAGGNMEPTWWSEKDTAMYDRDGGYVVNTIPGYQRRRKQGVGI